MPYSAYLFFLSLNRERRETLMFEGTMQTLPYALPYAFHRVSFYRLFLSRTG